MLSSGGTAERRRPRPGTGPGRCCPARPGGAVGARARGRAPTRSALDMGGTSCDVSLVLGGSAAVGQRAQRRRPGAGAADGGRAHGRRRRRLDRLARRRRRAARGAALGGRRPRPGLLRARRHRADRDRRQPAAGLPRRGVAAGRRRAPRRATPPSAAVGRARRRARARARTRPPPASRAWPTPRWPQAVRVVTVERGIDPRDLALVAFGGAGPLHAAQIAEELGMRRVVAPLAVGRAVRARADRSPSAAATWSRACCSAARRSRARPWPRRSRRLGEQARRGARRPRRRAARHLRPALRRPGLRAVRRRRARARAGRAARGVRRAPTRSATATPTRTPSWSS